MKKHLLLVLMTLNLIPAFSQLPGYFINNSESEIISTVTIHHPPLQDDVMERSVKYLVKRGKKQLELSLLRKKEHFFIPDEDDFIIDTNNPLANDAYQKEILESFLGQLKRPVVLYYDADNQLVERKENKNFKSLFWLSRIPQLADPLEFSSIFVELPSAKQQSFKDSVFSEFRNGYFITEYSLLEKDSMNIQTYAITGHFTPAADVVGGVDYENSNVFDLDDTDSPRDITVVSRLIFCNYEGKMNFDKRTGLVQECRLHIVERENLKMPGFNENINGDYVLTIKNTVR